jgi:hypothetical protein
MEAFSSLADYILYTQIANDLNSNRSVINIDQKIVYRKVKTVLSALSWPSSSPVLWIRIRIRMDPHQIPHPHQSDSNPAPTFQSDADPQQLLSTTLILH